METSSTRRSLVSRGVAAAAAGAGASLGTHLFNAMSQIGNREPGVVGAVLSDGRLFAGLIADGIVGPVTCAAIDARPASDIVAALCATRRARLAGERHRRLWRVADRAARRPQCHRRAPPLDDADRLSDAAGLA